MSWRDRMIPTAVTWVLLASAVVSVTWAHIDAGSDETARATLVSTRSAAWRVLPELANTSAQGATVELWPVHGEPVRLVPEPGGHMVWAGAEVLGPADPEAMEGVWDSLRLATTVRAADTSSEAGLGDGGRIVVQLPEGTVRTLELGRPTADGAGLYGTVEGGAEGTEGLWVLEQELSLLVQQAPEAWLARRALVAEPADVVVIRDGDLVAERGLDGLWRAQLGAQGPAMLLDRVAVETRLDRLVSARLDPLVEPQAADAGEPWITLEGQDGVDHVLRRHGACPGRPDRVVVDRGPGRWGCLDIALVEPWPLPGRDVPNPGALLDPRLLPHEYGRVLRVELRGVTPRVLARYGGGWRIEEEVGGRTSVFDVDESEVFRWYQALHDAEVALAPDDEPWPDTADVELQLVTDSTVTLRLRCAAGLPLRCRRDDGPVLEVRRTELPALAFDSDVFSERRLTAVRAEDVRAIEILPGPAGSQGVRQSVHFDLGIWRLDAPAHPEGDAALDSLRLEALLGAVGGLRAQAWVDDAADIAPLRRLRIEQVPRRGQEPVLEVELLPDCVVRVPGQRPGRLSEGTCETLGQDLLVERPFEHAIDTARELEITRAQAPTVQLRKQGVAWVDAAGGPALEVNTWLQGVHERRATAVVQGDPSGPRTWQLRVLPLRGTALTFEGGATWARIEGQGWHYALAEPADDADDDPAREPPLDDAPLDDEPLDDAPAREPPLDDGPDPAGG